MALPSPVLGSLDDGDLPLLHRRADQASIRGQRWFTALTGIRLVASVLAAGTTLVRTKVLIRGSEIEVAAAAAIVFFAIALLSEVALLRPRLQDDWYRGRELAEATKALAWRYAVAATPFPSSMRSGDAKKRFLHCLQLLQRSSPVFLAPTGSQDHDDGAIDELHAAPLDVRKKTYLHGRISAQKDWYDAAAIRHRRRANAWRAVLLLLEFTGVVLATLTLTGVSDVSAEGLVATAIGASSAWLQTKQHDRLTRRYSSTSLELDYRLSLGSEPMSEKAWSDYVDKTERVMLQEHERWLATHPEDDD